MSEHLIVGIITGAGSCFIGFCVGFGLGIRKGFSDGVEFMKEFLRACQKDGEAGRRGH